MNLKGFHVVEMRNLQLGIFEVLTPNFQKQ